jgi:malate dehydrogenase
MPPSPARTVAIVGAGDIGGATAQALAAHDQIGRVLLIDAAGDAAAGKALDIQQSGAVDGFHTRLQGATDETLIAGCDVCVVADQMQPGLGEWRGDEGLAMLGRIARYLGDTPIVFAGVAQLGLLATAAREMSLRRGRLIGSSPEALAASIKAIVALEARGSPREVMLTVLGRPGGFVVPWSEASIGGYALQRVLSQVQLARIEARAAHVWPPGPNALGAAAAVVTEAILSASRRSLSVLTWLDGEFGVRHVVGCLPARLSARGIDETHVPELGAREQVSLQTALNG